MNHFDMFKDETEVRAETEGQRLVAKDEFNPVLGNNINSVCQHGIEFKILEDIRNIYKTGTLTLLPSV